jgi:WD40 repeat protein
LTKKYSSACLKTLTGHLDFIWTIALLQDNITLFSGGLDKSIKMWDITTGNLIRNLPNEHTSHITKIVQFTKEIIISCSNDGTIKFWDFKANLCAHTVTL